MSEVFALSGSGLPLRANAETRGVSPAQRYAFVLPPRQAVRLAQARIAFPGVDLSPLEPQAPVEEAAASVDSIASRVSKEEIAAPFTETAVFHPLTQVSPSLATKPQFGETVVVRMENAERSSGAQPSLSHARADTQASFSEPSAVREIAVTPLAQPEMRVESRHTVETHTERQIVERLQAQLRTEHLDSLTHSETLRLEKTEKLAPASDPLIRLEQSSGQERLHETERLVEIQTAPRVKEVVRMASMGVPDRAPSTPQADLPMPMAMPILERIAAATSPKEEKAIRIGSVQVSVRSPAPAPAAAPVRQALPTSAVNGVAARSPYRNPWLSRNRQD